MQKLAVQCASRSAHDGVVGKPAASCCACGSIWQPVFLPLHHVLTYLYIAHTAFHQFRHFSAIFLHKFLFQFRILIMNVKKEPVSPVSQDSECQIIEVVDLMKQAKRDVGQTLAEMQAHVSLNLLSLGYSYMSVCLSVC